jgi:hypothetical protein
MKIQSIARTTRPLNGVKLYAKVMSAFGEDIYTVLYIRTKNVRRWMCNCSTFMYRQFGKGRNCKHIREIRAEYGRFGTKVPLS